MDYDVYVLLKQVVPKAYKDGFRANGYAVVQEIKVPAGTDILRLLLGKKKAKKRRKA